MKNLIDRLDAVTQWWELTPCYTTGHSVKNGYKLQTRLFDNLFTVDTIVYGSSVEEVIETTLRQIKEGRTTSQMHPVGTKTPAKPSRPAQTTTEATQAKPKLKLKGKK